jgi:universal stress protein A
MKVKPAPGKGGVFVELSSQEQQIPQLFPTAPVFKLKTILVPVDFSQCSKKALQYAVSFARQFGAELKLLHVLEQYPAVPELGPTGFETAAEGQAGLDAFRKTIDSTVRCSTTLSTGEPYEGIANAARELCADLIVMSTNGRRGLTRMVFGSTTEKVVRYAPCPVLIVRESEREFLTETPASSPEDH